MIDTWPLEQNRKFESEYFTQEEIEAKCQENSWLRNRDAEDGDFTEYPTYDYTYSCYECKTLNELKRALLYRNWAIRQCFTYKNLAFVNQINAGDEWWAIQKTRKGELIAFDSITMVAVINETKKQFIMTYRNPDPEERYTLSTEVDRHALELTKAFQAAFGETGRFVTGDYGDDEFNIYFEYIDHSYFRNYINECLEASKLGWYGYREVDGVRVE